MARTRRSTRAAAAKAGGTTPSSSGAFLSGTRIRQPAPAPDGEKMNLPNRAEWQPDVFKLKKHCLVKESDRRIFMLYQDTSKEAMEALFKHGAKVKIPNGEAELNDKGYLTLSSKRGDVVLLRPMYGTGEEEDDVWKSWATNPDTLSDDDKDLMRQVREDIKGTATEISPEKPRKVDGGYVGGLAFERTPLAVPVKKGERCYGITTAFQVPRQMFAPTPRNKRVPTKTGKANEATDNNVPGLINLIGLATERGLACGPPNLRKSLEIQANLTNLPRIGLDGNICHPTSQLNIATATSADSTEDLKSSLGRFGGSHIDGADSTTAPTAMTILTEPHPDVDDEYFVVPELGLAWKMDEFTTILFSGLHFHGGSQPRYAVVRQAPGVHYYRLTLINYPPSTYLDHPGALAFAGLPGEKGSVMTVGIEMRDPRLDPLTKSYLEGLKAPDVERSTGQATFTYDGGELMERTSYLDNFSRNIVQMMAYFAQQVPPQYRLKFDRDNILSSFSMLDEKGVRIQAKPWPYGPGWVSSDVHIGNVEDPLETDMVPYNNAERIQAIREWNETIKSSGSTIPISVVQQEQTVIEGNVVGNPGRRRATVKRVRQTTDSEDEVTNIVHPSKKKKTSHKRDNVQKQGTRANASKKPKRKQRQQSEDSDGEDMSSRMQTRDRSRFLQALNPAALDACLKTLQQMTTADILDKDIITSLTELLASGLSSDSTHISALRQISTHFTKIKHIHQVGNPIARSQGMVLMVLNMVIWEWLENLIAEPADWVSSLLLRIMTCLSIPSKEHRLSASDFIAGHTGDEAYVIHTTRYSWSSLDQDVAIDKATTIIAHWLHFPDREEYEPQAWFTRQLVDRLGIEALLLPAAEYGAQQLNTFVLNQGRNCRLTRQRIEDWAITHLWAHPMGSSQTKERVILEKITAHIVSLYPETQVMIDLFTPEGGREAAQIQPLLDLLSLVHPLLDDMERQIKIPHCSSKGYHVLSLLKEVQSEADKKLPFRDLAPSRKRILEDGGPYSSDHISTQAGFFSALIYRGVTHHTDFLQQQSILFPSLSSWVSLYKTLSTEFPPNYFCDPCAYGTCTSRSVDHIPEYWDVSEREDLTSWLAEEPPISFLNLYWKLREAEISAFGSLTTYLLVVDYAIAGKVQCPQPREMGEILWDIDAGGLKGLIKLGFPCRSVEETSQAFEIVTTMLSARLSEGDKSKMNFSVFLVEHLLCKLVRVGKTNMYKGAIREMKAGFTIN
ncbi:hypothetical protein BDN72DRAFT_906413 [Pluteus cervinus]|uniref:Uncharacterized protein n=1 Tax=Pluteus cervinus TaxID=181527 RepID=A0ACD2ZYY0_9AGAR|nr:hypothetical protein BDN72DRAFT_906413 [Pluteus cervinus]